METGFNFALLICIFRRGLIYLLSKNKSFNGFCPRWYDLIAGIEGLSSNRIGINLNLSSLKGHPQNEHHPSRIELSRRSFLITRNQVR